jgi:hypothetical protein
MSIKWDHKSTQSKDKSKKLFKEQLEKHNKIVDLNIFISL